MIVSSTSGIICISQTFNPMLAQRFAMKFEFLSKVLPVKISLPIIIIATLAYYLFTNLTKILFYYIHFINNFM